MSKLNTVNVIEMKDSNEGIYLLVSFEDTPEGNTEAEALFKTLVAEYGDQCTREMLDDGIYTDGEAVVWIVHSTN